jgi:hypothetical protein
MTPEEWERCADPWKMLKFVLASGRASDRKLRLFAVACCRRLASLLPDSRSRSALETCEQFAHGLADDEALRAAQQAAVLSYDEFQDGDGFCNFTGRESASAAVAGACWVEASRREAGLFDVVDNAIGLGELTTGWKNGKYIEQRRQCYSLRELFGPLPFRPVTVVAPAVLAWHGGAAVRLAESIDTARRFEDLPVLADLLEEAGYCDAELLAHLRGRGPHCFGCWALDTVLAKI